MYRMKTKICSAVLSVALVLSVVACHKSMPTTSNGNTTKINQESTTSQTEAFKPTQSIAISMMIAGDNTPNPENLVLDEIKKRTGYKIDMLYVPGADYDTKLNAFIVSKSLPDIFRVDATDAIELRNAGMLTDLTDILPEYAPHIVSEVGDNLLKSPANFDDRVYLVMRGALGYPMNTNIRTDWLKNVGMNMPTNLNEFYEVLKAFTENDPNQNGKKDTYGMTCNMNLYTSTFSSIFGAYGIPLGRNIQLDDGTVTTWFKHPLVLDAFKYLQKLYNEGLIEPDFATIPNMDMFSKLWTGVTGVIIFQCVGPTNNWMPSRYIEDPPPTFGFARLAGPGGSGGVPKVYPEYGSGWVLASSCEYPIDAVLLADYLTSEEGDELLYLGVEGVMFRWIDKEAGQYERIPPYNDDATHRAAGAFVYHGMFAGRNNTEVRLFNQQTREGVEFAHSMALEDAFIISSFQEDIEYKAALDAIIAEAFAQLIVTSGNIEDEYTEFIKRWDEEGGLIWQAAATKIYNEENP